MQGSQGAPASPSGKYFLILLINLLTSSATIYPLGRFISADTHSHTFENVNSLIISSASTGTSSSDSQKVGRCNPSDDGCLAPDSRGLLTPDSERLQG